tara:strand:+ start:6792 stop:7418 length:627 start_codon:yes stop_codon:yes gene_type:complete
MDQTQETHKKIFQMACGEFPHKHFTFNGEEAVLYRGFKISLKEGNYNWQDTRNDNNYQSVDPLITENILKRGFYVTLTLLMLHTDKEKMVRLDREIFERERQIKYWSGKSSEIWRTLKKQQKGIRENGNLSGTQKKQKLSLLDRRYKRKKNLYIKKRKVLKEEQEQLEANHAFYVSRIKSYKIQKLWESTVWGTEVPTKHSSTCSKET